MGSAIEASFVGLVLVVLFIALCRGWYTAEVVVFLSLLVVWNVGIVSTAEALSGFNNPGVLAIGALFVVVAAVESSGLADKAAKRVLGLTTSFPSGFLRLLLCAATMSAFCNNTPILALLIPVTRDWARTRGFSPEVLLMPVAYACAFGGLLTTVGGGTNLVIQGLLYEAGKEDEDVGPFQLFEPGYVGLPLALAGIAYLIVAAPNVLAAPKGGAVGRGVSSTALRDRSADVLTEMEVTRDFELLDQPFALVLASLGLPIETLVKVRRRRVLGNDPGVTPLSSLSADVPGGVHVNGGSNGDGEGDGIRIITGVCSPLAGQKEPNGSSWTGRIIGRVRAGSSSSRPAGTGRGGSGDGGGGRSPFAALRQRKSYQLLENEDDEERPGRIPREPGAGIEMAPLRAVGAADATREDGDPTANVAADHGIGGRVQRRCGVDEMHDVPPDALVRAGDVLVLSCDSDAMVCAQGSLMSGRKGGLRVLGVSTLRLPRPGSAFFELVLSRGSQFLGRTPRLENDAFAAHYGCSVVAFRLKGSTGGGVDLMGGTGTSVDCDADGSRGEEVYPCCGGSNRSSQGGPVELPEASPLRGDPQVPGSDASTRLATAVADYECGEAFFIGGDDSPMVDSSRSPRGPAAASMLPAGDGTSPTLSSRTEISGQGQHGSWRQHRAGEAFLGAKRRRRPRGEAFQAGDVVVVLATERFSEWCDSSAPPGEFLRKKLIGRLPEPTGWFHFFPLTIFALMLAWVLFGGVDMIRAVFTAAAVLLLAGWVDAKQAVGHVNWGLLLLIGSALGFSKAIANSGLAGFAGRAVRESGMSPSASLYALFGLTMFCTELISNNAAAALNIPIALSMARELKSDYKPFAMTVLVAASCSFLTPIGTPTNTLVWKPGGYKFQDYAKLGAPLSLLFWVAACAAIPWVFPF